MCWYLDNEASRSAYLKAYGATEVADGLVAAFTEVEMVLQIKSWFVRVPSSSNLADASSRGEDSKLRDRGVLQLKSGGSFSLTHHPINAVAHL